MARMGLLLLSAGLVLFPFAHGYPLLLFAMTLMPLGTAFTFPAVTALLSRVVPSRERGLYMGVQQTIGGVSRVVFPWWDGWAFDHIGVASPFVVCGILTAGTLGLIRGVRVPAVPAPAGEPSAPHPPSAPAGGGGPGWTAAGDARERPRRFSRRSLMTSRLLAGESPRDGGASSITVGDTMTRRSARLRVPRWTEAAIIVVVAALLPSPARAQTERASLLQIEVGDSIGLPLPDATLEVFTVLDRGIAWEWAPVDPSELPEGTNLLRISHAGYRPAVFSVPLRSGSHVALRVRLHPMGDSAARARAPQADEVRSIGLAIDGRARTDIIGVRRVLDRGAIAASAAPTLGALLRRTKGTNLNLLPARGGTFRPYTESQRGGSRCPAAVMVNGDRRRIFAFETADQLFSPEGIESIEIFPRGSSVPLAYQVPQSSCGVIVVWFRNP